MKDFLREYWYVILGWPVLAAIVSWMRLGGSSPSSYEWVALFLGYLIVGVVAAWQTRWIISRKANFGSLIGFGVATPIAYLVSVNMPAWNTWVFSLSQPLTFIVVIPLLIGISAGVVLILGTRVGGLLDRQPPLQKIN
jgi:hypothetical protein